MLQPTEREVEQITIIIFSKRVEPVYILLQPPYRIMLRMKSDLMEKKTKELGMTHGE